MISTVVLAATGVFSSGAPAVDLRPVTTDPMVQSLRPNGRCIGTIRVAADGSKDYTNLRTACAAALTMQTNKRATEGNPPLNPNYRVDVIVYPGTYTGEIAPSPFVGFYLEGSPHSAVLNQILGVGDYLGVIANNGNTYWEGIDIVELYQASYPNANPKYPVHAVNSGTNIWVNTTFDHQGGAGMTPYGMDGADGGTTLIYNCVLKPGNLNCHGWAHTRVPQTMMYVNCTSEGTVNWNALNDIAVDHLWVVGGSAKGIRLEGAASKLHRDPATVLGIDGVVSPSTDNNTNWPVPYGGLSATDRAYWGM